MQRGRFGARKVENFGPPDGLDLLRQLAGGATFDDADQRRAESGFPAEIRIAHTASLEKPGKGDPEWIERSRCLRVSAHPCTLGTPHRFGIADPWN